MRPAKLRRTRLRSRAGWSGRDIVWALFGSAALVLAGAFVTSLAVQGKLTAILQGKVVVRAPAPDAFREGSILFVSRDSSLCRKQALDNKTGQIGGARLVNCNGGPIDQTTNVEAFRDGFQRNKQSTASGATAPHFLRTPPY